MRESAKKKKEEIRNFLQRLESARIGVLSRTCNGWKRHAYTNGRLFLISDFDSASYIDKNE